MADLEQAYLRLKCWKLLEGWGQVKADGGIAKWDFNKRMENAALMADWASGPAASIDEHLNFTK